MKEPDLSEWHLVVLSDMIVLSVSVEPGAQELQPMMFLPKCVPILSARTRQD